MAQGFPTANVPARPRRWVLRLSPLWLLLLLLGPRRDLRAQKASDDIDDITGKYHFLTADDTLAILEEEGKLHGYIDVYQGEDESDAILSYPISTGERKNDHGDQDRQNPPALLPLR